MCAGSRHPVWHRMGPAHSQWQRQRVLVDQRQRRGECNQNVAPCATAILLDVAQGQTQGTYCVTAYFSNQRRLKGTSAMQYYTPFDLRAFPFDRQNLKIQMEIPQARCRCLLRTLWRMLRRRHLPPVCISYSLAVSRRTYHLTGHLIAACNVTLTI